MERSIGWMSTKLGCKISVICVGNRRVSKRLSAHHSSLTNFYGSAKRPHFHPRVSAASTATSKRLPAASSAGSDLSSLLHLRLLVSTASITPSQRCDKAFSALWYYLEQLVPSTAFDLTPAHASARPACCCLSSLPPRPRPALPSIRLAHPQMAY